ncbi:MULTISPECIES: DNA/RNA nuclease SfsA [unclassified Microcoleus]|uniref:DNA/RNA nuclease SfsA n=1 Tax=unclassified Microcoleus TaxID=2642155 RepID=UPI002FCE7B59
MSSSFTRNSHQAVQDFINRGDCTDFAPEDSADRIYGELFRQTINAGVEIVPCRFEMTPEGIRYLGLSKLDI